MTGQVIAGWVSGIAFMLLLLGIALFILLRKNEEPISPEAFFIFRVVLALAGAAFALILIGFLEVEAVWASVTIRAGGTLAVFILLYLVNPPALVQPRKLPTPKTPVKRRVPQDRVNEAGEEEPTK
jgi:small-conductance mechanosensitive channel